MTDDRAEPSDSRSCTCERSDGVAPDGDPVEGWPTELVGVTETIVATRGPNDRWNQATLGVESAGSAAVDPTPVATARTWGHTRTRRNVEAGREAYVQFTADPLDVAAAALSVFETDEPILVRSGAWVRVAVERIDSHVEHGTEVVEWSLEPREAAVRRRAVPTTNRGRAAVVEATVAASRLGVDAYDDETLRERLSWLETIVERCGGPRATAAMALVAERLG